MPSPYTGSVTQIPSRDNIIKSFIALCECTWYAAQAVEMGNLKWGLNAPDAGAKPLKPTGLWETGWEMLPDVSEGCSYHRYRYGESLRHRQHWKLLGIAFPSQPLLPPDIQVKSEETKLLTGTADINRNYRFTRQMFAILFSEQTADFKYPVMLI